MTHDEAEELAVAISNLIVAHAAGAVKLSNSGPTAAKSVREDINQEFETLVETLERLT